MLTSSLKGIDVTDFQDLGTWRSLVPPVARGISEISGQDLVAVQSVLVQDHWHELRRGMLGEGLDVFHVLLDADEEALRQRIAGDEDDRDAAQWHLDHVGAYVGARDWLTRDADEVVDTSGVAQAEVARRIIEKLDERQSAVADR